MLDDDLPEVDVTVREVLTKNTCIVSDGGHTVYEREYDAMEGGYVNTSFYEPGNVKADFENQCRYAHQCLQDCCKVLRELILTVLENKHHIFAGIDVVQLLEDCEGWNSEECSIDN